VIALDAVSKRYGATVAVDNLTLSVDEAELFVLLGGSGSGKTTVLKTINRLIDPTGGAIRIDGEDVARLPSHLLRRRIGYVFQKIGLFPHMTVAENIAVTPGLLGWSTDRIRTRVDELLRLVELEPAMASRFPESLSGGEQQRVGVARALAAEPKVMLLDEPFGALDPLTRDRLQRSFVDISRKLKLTSIFVTHDMVEALLLGDRIGIMNGGKLIQVGTPRELLLHPANDYVRRLMETPKQHASVIERLMSKAGVS
jgi:osmoprotectant transport system ATP-binding protein